MKLTKELLIRIASFIHRVLGCVLAQYAQREGDVEEDDGRFSRVPLLRA